MIQPLGISTLWIPKLQETVGDSIGYKISGDSKVRWEAQPSFQQHFSRHPNKALFGHPSSKRDYARIDSNHPQRAFERTSRD